MADERDITEGELAERVVFALLGGAARCATLAGLPARGASELLSVRVFEVLRRRGLPIREIAARLGVSERTAAGLSRRLKRTFLSADRAHTLPRRVEFVLGGGPLGAARVRQALGDVTRPAVDAALAELVAQGRVERLPGRTPRYRTTGHASRLPRDTWLARIDGLDHLMATIGDAVAGRFFRDEPRAFARTLSLRVRPADLPALQALYETHIWPTLAALDEAAAKDPDAEAVNLAVIWAPRDYIETLEEEDES